MPDKSPRPGGAGEPGALALFGAGHVTRALLPLLPAAGFGPLTVCSRRISAARAACRRVRGTRPRATTRPEVAVERARILLLAVPDREIAGLASRLARLRNVEWSRRVVLHLAGSAGPEILSPLAALGAGTGVMHPLQCLGEPALAASLLPGSRARIEGDRRGRPEAARLARALGLEPLRLPADLTAEHRSAYHAAASLLSNDLVALLALGLDLMELAGVGRKPALEGLTALARGTLLQVERKGLEGAMTGPVARGDVETLKAQLDQASRVPGAAEVHRLLSRRLAGIARSRGSAAAARRVERLLAAGSGRTRKSTV